MKRWDVSRVDLCALERLATKGFGDDADGADSHLVLTIRGLVFAKDPSVLPGLRGINDETEFRALVSCLTSEGKGKGGRGKVQTVNIMTGGFPATPAGDSDIDTTINLPDQCVAPIIFVLAGSEDLWFAVNGFERE